MRRGPSGTHSLHRRASRVVRKPFTSIFGTSKTSHTITRLAPWSEHRVNSIPKSPSEVWPEASAYSAGKQSVSHIRINPGHRRRDSISSLTIRPSLPQIAGEQCKFSRIASLNQIAAAHQIRNKHLAPNITALCYIYTRGSETWPGFRLVSRL